MVGDKDKVWYPQRVIDYAEMERRSAERAYARIHEERPFHDGFFKNWSEKPTDMAPYHFMDGVKIIVAETDLNPDDHFLRAPDHVEYMQPTEE